MGKGGAPDIRPGDGPVVAGLIFGIAAILYIGAAIEAQFPADCGYLKHGYTQPLLSQSELIALPPTCSFSPLAEYPTRARWISSGERPCTFGHILDIYPPPQCKRGEVVRMTRVRPVVRDGRRYVVAGVLCCPVSGGDEGDGVNDANATLGRGDGEL